MNNLEQRLWQDWAKHYEDLGIPSNRICKDGIADESLFRVEKSRVLFVLKEANDWKEGDIRIILNEPRLQIFNTTGRWAAGLIKDFPPYEEVNSSQEIAWALKRVAWVNLKKATGGATANMNLISAYASRDRELILRQMQYIAPQVIVACGTFEYCWWLLNLPIDLPWDNGHAMPWKKPVYCELLDAWVLPHVHPTRSSNKETYEGLRNMYQMAQRSGRQ